MEQRPPQPTQQPVRHVVSKPATAVAVRPAAQFSSNREIAVVQADYLALANDLEQAQALASSLELQLSGKSNELARFKSIWERTQADLTKLERDVDAMRKERHALANEAQRAYAFEHRYEKLKITHDELVNRAAALEAELATERAALGCTREKLAQEIAKGTGGVAEAVDPALRSALEAIRAQIDAVLRRPVTAVVARKSPVSGSEHIDIEFEP